VHRSRLGSIVIDCDDIETDNVEAETRRLEALGATRKTEYSDYWIMEDPCGNEFCVILPGVKGFPEGIREW